MHLYFVRHGESEANAEGIVAGQGIDVHLTSQGEKQAHDAAKWLVENKISIDAIVSSPSLRTRQTATIIAHEIGFKAKDILYRHDLIERYCGEYEGGPLDAYNEAPESIAVKEMGVESLDDLYTRVKRLMDEISKSFADKTVLVVSHNGTGKMIRIVIEGRDASEMDKAVMLPNANVSKII